MPWEVWLEQFPAEGRGLPETLSILSDQALVPDMMGFLVSAMAL